MARRLVDFLGPTNVAARQSLTALGINSVTSFAAGAVLVGVLDTFSSLPGLLVMVTPAIGLRGNVFTTLGNRLSTGIHTGTFRLSFRRDSVLVQNLVASFVLTTVMSSVLAVMAKVISVVVGIEHTIGLLQLAFVSLLGGMLGSIPVALATVLLAVGAVRYGWDLDNLVAPTVEALGDALTVPALFVAALLVTDGPVVAVIGGLGLAGSVVLLVVAWRSGGELLSQVVRESVPILGVALLLSALAGLVLQKQEAILAILPAVLLMQPAFVSSAGALGSILSARVSTNLHLGNVEPTLVPGRTARQDTSFLLGLAVPVFVFNAAGATLFSWWQGDVAPGLWWMLTATVISASVTMAFVVAISYYATIGAWRVELDPDTSGVPIVTAAVDFVGTVVLVFCVVSLGLV
jgi:mgtE-like transporter